MTLSDSISPHISRQTTVVIVSLVQPSLVRGSREGGVGDKNADAISSDVVLIYCVLV